MKQYRVLDIGGTFIKYALMGEDGSFLENGKVPSPMDSLESLLDAVAAVGEKFRGRYEGAAVSMPLRREGLSRAKCFFYGQLSGLAEPVAAVVGALAVVAAQPILPYALAFAAGAMIFVAAEELIPEAKRGSPDIAAMSLMVGFAVMMTLDVALG